MTYKTGNIDFICVSLAISNEQLRKIQFKMVNAGKLSFPAFPYIVNTALLFFQDYKAKRWDLYHAPYGLVIPLVKTIFVKCHFPVAFRQCEFCGLF